MGLGTRLAILIALGVLLRCWLIASAEPPVVSDASDYVILARSVADGEGYQQRYGPGTPFGDLTLRAYRAPGYPLLRAAMMAVSDEAAGAGAALVLNLVCEVLAALILIALALRRRRRLLAIAFAALWALHVTWTVSPMTESLAMALYAALLYALAYAPRTWRVSAITGVVLAVAVLVRPASLVLLPVALWVELASRAPSRLFRLSALLATLALGVGSWSVRNYLVLGAPVLISTNLGIHNAHEFGLGIAAYEGLQVSGLGEVEINRRLVQRELSIALADPLFMPRLILQRIHDLFVVSTQSCYELALHQESTFEDPLARRAHWLSFVHAPAVYVLSLASLPSALRRGSDLRLAGLLTLAFVIGHSLISRGDARLLAPAYPWLAFLAAHALTRLWDSRTPQAC